MNLLQLKELHLKQKADLENLKLFFKESYQLALKILETIPDEDITEMFTQSLEIDSSLSVLFVSKDTGSSRVCFIKYLDLVQNDWDSVYFETDMLNNEVETLSKKFNLLGVRLHSIDLDFIDNQKVTLYIDIVRKTIPVNTIKTFLKNIFGNDLILDKNADFDIEQFEVKSSFFIA